MFLEIKLLVWPPVELARAVRGIGVNKKKQSEFLVLIEISKRSLCKFSFDTVIWTVW